MEIKRAKEWIRERLCWGRLVGYTKPIIDEPWQAGEMAIKSIDAWKNVVQKIEARLESEREYNTQLNKASDFYMTHEIANTSGKIHGMAWVLDVIKEEFPEAFEKETGSETENGKQDKD